MQTMAAVTLASPIEEIDNATSHMLAGEVLSDRHSFEHPPGLEFGSEEEGQLQAHELEQAQCLELPPGLLPPPGLELPNSDTGGGGYSQAPEDVGVDAGNPIHVSLHCSKADEQQSVASKAYIAEDDSDKETSAGSEVSESFHSDSSHPNSESSSLAAIAQPGSILRAALQAQLTEVKGQTTKMTRTPLNPSAHIFVPSLPSESAFGKAATWQESDPMDIHMPGMPCPVSAPQHSRVRRGRRAGKAHRARCGEENGLTQ